jgi:hypothetical protein
MSKNSNTYSLPWPRKVITFLFVFLVSAIALYMITGLCYLLVSVPSDVELSEVILLALIIGGMMIFLAPFILIFPNLEPDIQVVDEGLRVQFFWFWWLFIPWEDIESIQTPLFGLSRSRLLLSPKLTVIHRLIGTCYRTFFRPAVLISSTLKGYNELIRIIKDKSGKT